MSSPQQRAEIRAKLVCGVCGRLLDRLIYYVGNSRPLSQRIGEDGLTANGWKPSIGRSNTAIYAIHGDVPRTGQQRYKCHRRCGAVHVLRVERLTTAMLSGRNPIRAGIDI